MTALYRIGVVSKRVGVSIGALRVWENEYGLLKPKRSAGGTRLYSDSDIETARSIHGLVHERGYSLSSLSRVHDQVSFVRGAEVDVHAILCRIVRAEDLWDATRALVEGVRALTGVGSARLAMFRPQSASLAFVATSHRNGTFRYACPPIAIERLPIAWQRALESRRPHSDPDLRHVPLPDEVRMRLDKEATRSFYAEPLTVGERLVGVLAVGGVRPGGFSARVRYVCERLAVPAGPALRYFADRL